MFIKRNILLVWKIFWDIVIIPINKPLEPLHWRPSGVFIVNFEQISHVVLFLHIWLWASKYRLAHISILSNTCSVNLNRMLTWTKRHTLNLHVTSMKHIDIWLTLTVDCAIIYPFKLRDIKMATSSMFSLGAVLISIKEEFV